jgi:tRNA pseudouridine55 synthase
MGLDGVIIIDKPCGVSSSAVVLQVKRIIGARKAGHAGTLDPLATGVLPLCINEGTKLVPFFMQGEKEYIATLRLGIETDTQDREGTVIRRSEKIPLDQSEVERIFNEFQGEVLQTPPMFSALKHNGIPLYRIARRGENIPRRARRITIDRIRVLSFDAPYISFFVRCSPGTYIRTLCADIGARLHCGAHLVELKRVRNGAFHITRSLPLEDLRNAARNGSVGKHLIPLNEALPDLPAVVIDRQLGKKVSHGMPCSARDVAGMALPQFAAGNRIKLVTADGRLIAIAACCIESDALPWLAPHQLVFKILRNFQLQEFD